MLRIAICQRTLRRYRLPVYDLLGRQEGIDLTVFAEPASCAAQVLTEDPTAYRLVRRPTRTIRWLPGQFSIQPAQREAMDPDRFDLVVLPWDNHYLFSLWPALRRARRRSLPVGLWGHGFSKRPRRATDWLRTMIGRRGDALLLYSRTVAQHLIERSGFDPERVFVAQNALDQAPIAAARAHWQSSPGALETFQREHGLRPDRTIVFVSRLLEENRADLLIDALVRVRRKHADTKLVLVGDGPCRDQLQQQADRLGQRGHVVFAGAIYDDMDLAPWMLSATLFCYPVNIGLSILHAFGYGLPVVTSDDLPSHNPEIEALEPRENGLLYRDGDVADLAAAWIEILEDPHLRDRLGHAALEQVTTKYTLANMVQGFLDLCSIVDGQVRQVDVAEQACAS